MHDLIVTLGGGNLFKSRSNLLSVETQKLMATIPSGASGLSAV